MKQACVTALMLAMTAGCGSDSDSQSVDEQLDSLERGANATARDVCGVTDEELNSDDESEAVACYYELAFEFDSCERAALRAHPDDVEGLLACVQRDQEALVACCQEDGPCTYAKIEGCYETLWDGFSSGDCETEIPFDAELEGCAEEQGTDA
jgi:hypothetical protein